MSLCRRGCDGSDIYIYECGDKFCCDTCNLNNGEDTFAFQFKEGIEHIRLHLQNGDKVPQHLINYFDMNMKSGLISNVTQEDLMVIPSRSGDDSIELRFKLSGQEFGLGLVISEDVRKNIDKLFSSAKITILNILDQEATLTKEGEE